MLSRLFIGLTALTFSIDALADALTPQEFRAIQNASYEVQYGNAQHERALFKDGVFTKRVDDINYSFGIAKEPILRAADGSVYVIMGINAGGTGNWSTVKRVKLDSNPALEIKSYPQIPEDRIQITNMKIEGRKLKLTVIRHAANDPLCCPTVHDVIDYSVK